MRDGRWTTVTPSRFQLEREALEHVRNVLPDAEPYRAWSNFTFTANTGHVYEVDLLVATPGGLYLIEIKSLRGRLRSIGANWVLSGPSGSAQRTFDNPLHLADSKAKQLRSLLSVEASKKRRSPRVPFIQAAVFLSVPGLTVDLAEHQLHWVFGPQPVPGDAAARRSPLPPIGSGLLERPPRDERSRVTPEVSKELPKLLEGVGIARSRRHYQVGSWELSAQPFDVGPTWQDHLATHAQLPQEKRRIRIYLVERNAVASERASIERAARREMVALHGISHPGIVQVDTMEPHEAGPALVFRHDPRALRLDHYLAQYSERLDLLARLDMARQIAEALRYAHGRHLYHRTLSARSVLVLPGHRRKGPKAARSLPPPKADVSGSPGRGEDEAWLNPRVQVSDWQAAARGQGSSGSGFAGTAPTSGVGPGSGSGSRAAMMAGLTPTGHAVAHVERSAEAYLAPELTAPNPDPVAMDVFGLGTLTYLLLTSQPPAGGRAELLSLLASDNGLRPSSVADAMSEFCDELVQAATAPVPAQRLTSVAEFLEMLDVVEEDLTAPERDAAAQAGTPEVEPDPLEARPGDLVGGEWRVVKRLGTGSTSTAFLTHNERTNRQEVLKVALSDEKATRLAHEARVLRPLTDSRIIRLARQEPILIGERTAIVLEHAGEASVARKLRDDGRLSVDELETFSDYLFGALDYLEGEGVSHRDIKPDNIAIRVRPNRTRQLVLFDFSLAGISVQEIDAGTPRYLDPFLGSVRRPVYDAHAERYALAVTLHEMASGELPVWGDGATGEIVTEGPPVLAVEAFDPAIRDGLVTFFLRALNRDAQQRFESLKQMRDAWTDIFRASDSVPPVGSEHPGLGADTGMAAGVGARVGARVGVGVVGGDGDGAGPGVGDVEAVPGGVPGGRFGGLLGDDAARAAERARDEAAARAGRETVLEAAGLTPRAVSAAHRLDATTVADLLALGSKQIFNLPGIGARTRQELQHRIRQWRDRLGDGQPPQPRPGQGAATGEAAASTADPAAAATATATAVSAAAGGGQREVSEEELVRVGLDAVVALLVPEPNRGGRNATEVEATRLLLRLPDAAGALPEAPPWPQQPLVAAALGVSSGRVAQILAKQRRRWRDIAVVRSVHAEVVELLAGNGRVMGVPELAAALLARRGSTRTGDDVRWAVATAALRAAVEVDSLLGDPRLLIRRHGDRLLAALEVTEDDDPRTPSAPALLDYADALGKVADRLAGYEVLPAPATVLGELAAVPAPGLVHPVDGGAGRADGAGGADGGVDGGAQTPHGGWPFDAGRPFDERRLVQLAAAASQRAAATPRSEIYPRGLEPVRALRLAQAGVVMPSFNGAGLVPAQVADRVQARFPALAPLPDDPSTLLALLREAGFDLVWRDGFFVPAGSGLTSPSVSSGAWTRRHTSWWAAESPEQAAALRAEQQLRGAAAEGGFRALTVRRGSYLAARAGLAGEFAAEPVNVAAAFLAALHALVDPRPKPTWETVLAADVAAPSSRAAIKLAEFVAEAWARVRPGLLGMAGVTSGGGAAVGSGGSSGDAGSGGEAGGSAGSGGEPGGSAGSGAAGGSGGLAAGPLLLCEAAPMARYNAMDVLHELAEQAREGGRAVWLLCPVDDPGRPPRLDGTVVPVVTENEWVVLPDAWVRGMHRNGEQAS